MILRGSAGACIALLLALASAGAAQAPGGGPPPTLVGMWRGTSICTPVGKPACHDETVVYHVSPAAGQGAAASAGDTVRLAVVMNKIVDGKEEEMGDLVCAYAPRTGLATCPMRGWTWRFQARGDAIRGTLANPTGVVWRNINVTRTGN
jgi:hypothetical protein